VGAGSRSARGRVLDAGALIAIERGDERARALVQGTRRLIIPAPVLDEHVAKSAGVLLGRTGTSDVADASVVLAARRYAAVVVTDDAADIRRLDPQLPIAEL